MAMVEWLHSIIKKLASIQPREDITFGAIIINIVRGEDAVVASWLRLSVLCMWINSLRSMHPGLIVYMSVAGCRRYCRSASGGEVSWHRRRDDQVTPVDVRRLFGKRHFF